MKQRHYLNESLRNNLSFGMGHNPGINREEAHKLRVSVHRERSDRWIVNTGIGDHEHLDNPPEFDDPRPHE
ncbi:MAG: hypothetical protein F9K13_06510 [Candidatus Methylomirabilis oxygeniifera]|uniref:Uncharacterized protein n=1 Tax=Methylomirabilis oxygeniifera TaxID=671143 RepID=D5MHH4_METO1|nr:MAG: hypothetical protein F9K13_06510 [Candidatus Methylomirabilis oxyfera]CBE69206.1 protein of unknown function [Candidatus Methylomirabilis oxyfera]